MDASALLAIVLDGPDAALYARAIAADRHPRLPSVTWLEAALRIEFAGDAVAASRFDECPWDFGIEIIPVTRRHAEAARLGRRLYGRPHRPAGLNFGDCLVCGVARAEREPLLFKGADFAHTDVEPALKE